MLEHPHLAPVLVLEIARRLLEGERVGRVDGPAPTLHHHVRKREVVAEPRVDLDVVGAPHGVDRAVAAGHRSEPGLLLAQPQLVAPVGALEVRPVGRAAGRACRRRRRHRGRRRRRRASSGHRAPRWRWRRRRPRSHRRSRGTARFCAATLPPRGQRRRRTRGSRAATRSTIASVPSSEASEATTTSRRSGG